MTVLAGCRQGELYLPARIARRRMGRLNYHHLYYFWTVAREGTVARACAVLHLTQPTVSGHLRSVERALGARLFTRSGRTLALTAAGREAFRLADEIFSLGRELEGLLRDGRPTRVLIGVGDTMPKEVAHRLIEPVLAVPEPPRVVCQNGPPDELVARLAVNALDVVLADAPAPSAARVRAYNHLLGECGLSFMAAPDLAARYAPGFPASLDGAPVLLPAEGTVVRRSLDQWLAARGIRPAVRGEFSDPGLLKLFGQAGAGVFPVRAAVEAETERQYGVRLVGRADDIRERFYAISAERRLSHPAVVAMTAAARRGLFAPPVAGKTDG